MRSALLLMGLMLFMGMACSNGQAPVAPSNPQTNLPVWTVDLNGTAYEVGPADLIGDRLLAVVVPGTDMTVAELRIYFAVNITKATFPYSRYWCMVYPFIYGAIAAQPDAEVLRWVEVMESNGYDVPNGPPPSPPKCK